MLVNYDVIGNGRQMFSTPSEWLPAQSTQSMGQVSLIFVMYSWFCQKFGIFVTPPPPPQPYLYPLQKMRYVAAYLLAALGGNDSPSKADLTKILESVGLDIDDDRLDKVSEF